MYCKFCGNEIADESRFCKYCGRRIEDVRDEQDYNSDEISKNQDSRNDNPMMAIFIRALVISVLCASIYALVRFDDSKPYVSYMSYTRHSVYDEELDLYYYNDWDFSQITNKRKELYHKRIVNTFLISFLSSFVMFTGIALLKYRNSINKTKVIEKKDNIDINDALGL